MTEPTMAQLFQTRGRDRCPICREPVAGTLSIQLRGEDGADDGDNKRSISQSVRLCDRHVSLGWVRLSQMFDVFRAGGRHAIFEEETIA